MLHPITGERERGEKVGVRSAQAERTEDEQERACQAQDCRVLARVGL